MGGAQVEPVSVDVALTREATTANARRAVRSAILPGKGAQRSRKATGKGKEAVDTKTCGEHHGTESFALFYSAVAVADRSHATSMPARSPARGRGQIDERVLIKIESETKDSMDAIDAIDAAGDGG